MLGTAAVVEPLLALLLCVDITLESLGVGGVNAGRTRLIAAEVPPATAGSSADSVGLLSVLGPAIETWLLLVGAVVSNVAGLKQ